MKENGLSLAAVFDKLMQLEEQGKTVMLLASSGKLEGLVAVADTVKEHSASAISAIEKLGIEVWMLTGDNLRTAQAIASQVGIKRVLAEVLPELRLAHR